MDGVGRLEVFYNGAYGSVCSDGWTAGSETVACRGMGYSGATLWIIVIIMSWIMDNVN